MTSLHMTAHILLCQEGGVGVGLQNITYIDDTYHIIDIHVVRCV